MARIKREHDKCVACCLCEIACSLQHTQTINPKRSRIRVFMAGDSFFPAMPKLKDPHTGIRLKCDLCGEPPDPQCVKVCLSGALTFVK